MDQHLDTLRKMERDLRQQLELSPIFTKWKQITQTIEVFANGNGLQVKANDPEEEEEDEDSLPIPDTYSIDDMTWRQKIKFAIKKLGECSVADMVKFLQKQGETMEEDKLIKRVGVTASRLNKDEKIKSRLIGRKGMYSL